MFLKCFHVIKAFNLVSLFKLCGVLLHPVMFFSLNLYFMLTLSCFLSFLRFVIIFLFTPVLSSPRFDSFSSFSSYLVFPTLKASVLSPKSPDKYLHVEV